MSNTKNYLEQALLSVQNNSELYKMILDCLYLCQDEVSIKKQSSTMLELPSGTKVWVLNPQDLDVENFNWDEAKLHRDNDLPAVEWPDGSKKWYKNGKLHRDNGLPAIAYSNGTKQWYQNGKLHRDNDLPAVEYPGAIKSWYQNGKFVR